MPPENIVEKFETVVDQLEKFLDTDPQQGEINYFMDVEDCNTLMDGITLLQDRADGFRRKCMHHEEEIRQLKRKIEEYKGMVADLTKPVAT